MNKELLNENLNLILEGLKTVIHTANAELPAIFEKIVKWGIIEHSVLSIIFLVCTLLCVGTAIFLGKKAWEYSLDESPVAIAFFVTASLMFIVLFSYNLFQLFFAYTSPKLYIIHYLKDLLQ